MYPDRDTLSNVPRSGYIAARDQSMVESGVIEGGKNTASPQFVVVYHLQKIQLKSKWHMTF